MYTIEAIAGADRTVTLSLLDVSGTAITSYTGSATLAAKVWPGGDRAAVWTPTTAWAATSPSANQVTVSWSDTDTASVTPGLYRLRLSVTAGTVTSTFDPAFVRLYPAIGTTSEPSVYATFDDVERVAPWITELIGTSPSIESDLGEYRQRARARLDDRIVNRYTRMVNGQRLRWIDNEPVDGNNRDTIRGYLDGNKLMTSGRRGDVVREICARWTVSLVCENQIGKGPGETSLQQIARDYAARAESLLVGYTAEIDTDGDGESELRIPMGQRTTR